MLGRSDTKLTAEIYSLRDFASVERVGGTRIEGNPIECCLSSGAVDHRVNPRFISLLSEAVTQTFTKDGAEMPGSGSDTSPFPNSDGQSSDAPSSDEIETARNRPTPENESRDERHSFDLLKILEEGWLNREVGDPLVAAYHVGRLINAEEWLWLWVSICGTAQHESLPGKVHAKVVEVAHRMAEPGECEAVRRTLDLIHADWNEWSRSELCLTAIENLDETLSALDSSDRAGPKRARSFACWRIISNKYKSSP